MAFFDDILDFGGQAFDSLTGQQAIPQATILDPNQLLAQSYGALNAQLPALNQYNQDLALGNARAQLGYEAAINPYANQVRSGAYKSVLDNLNLGTSLSPELEADITRKLFETGSATGFGYSPASMGNIALQTGLQQQALGRQRQQDALQAAGGLALTGAGFQPTQGLNVGGVADLFQQQQSAQDQLNYVQEQARQENFSALLNTGTKILGGIAGGFIGSAMGNPVGGALGGAAAGSTIFGRAGGSGQSLGLLAGLFGGGMGGSRAPLGESGGFPTSQNLGSMGSFTQYGF